MTGLPLVAVVPRKDAENLRRHLRLLGAIDSNRKITKRDGKVLIPVLSRDLEDVTVCEFEVTEDPVPEERARQSPPIDSIRRHAAIDQPLKRLLPESWEKVGDVLIIRLPPGLRDCKSAVGQAYAEVLGVKSVLEDVGAIVGDWRLPRVEKVWGGSTETIHLEDGVRFKLDAAKVMFSSGNLAERMRMARIPKDGETVVDMFAGIGYFTIPMAVHSRPRIVHACEVNPTAFHYLQENIRINRVESVKPLLGDCRETAPEGVADRVIMGYLRGQGYLGKAMRVVADEGVMHYHESCPNDLAGSRPWLAVKEAADMAGRHVELMRAHRLKSYAPGVSHMVLDVRVSG